MILSHTHFVHDVNGDILQAIRDDMDAQEIEALSMLSRGFTELKEANPELAYNIVLDILSGINEYVVVYHDARLLHLTSPKQCCSATACPDVAWAIPAQANHTKERDDGQGFDRDRSSRGRSCHGLRSRCITRKER